MNQRTPWIVFATVLAAIVLCIGAGGTIVAGSAYDSAYAGRIYPGVTVYGVDLSGLTVDEAAVVLAAALPDPGALPLTLRHGDQVWNRTWADVGIHLDTLTTARLAYQVGRGDSVDQRSLVQLQALVTGWPLSPVVVLPDRGQAIQALQLLAPELAVPATNATLIIAADGVTPVPARAGRELDVEATLTALPQAVRVGPAGLVLELMSRQVEPAIGNPGPVQAQAESLLTQPFTLSAHDRLTRFSATWAAEPQTVAGWLVAQPVEDESGARLVLTIREEAVRTFLEDLNSQLTTDEVAIDVEKALSTVRAAVEAVESQAAVPLVHPPRTYVVQPGDTLMSIARAHGFPLWRMTEANPGLDPAGLHPGQGITIPSLDILFPLPLITDRHILIDISDLRLYAYEGETLVYNFPCSTGIDSSPTIPGRFQVLGKEENAYASSWDLWMPHFLGIYRSGPDFTNGVHGLPTLSSGALLWAGYLGNRRISYGCIVIGLQEAAILYDWAELGTLVIIQD